MPILHMMMGIQGSGKSTYSRKLSNELGIKIMSTDEVRKANPNLEEKFVFPEVFRLISNELNENRDVIFDATNITPNVRNRNLNSIKALCKDFEVYLYFINTDVEICKKRVEKRNTFQGEIYIPLEVIESYSKNIIPPTEDEHFDKVIIINNYKEF